MISKHLEELNTVRHFLFTQAVKREDCFQEFLDMYNLLDGVRDALFAMERVTDAVHAMERSR